MGIRRSATAEKTQSINSGNLMPSTGGNQNSVTWAHFCFFAIDLEEPSFVVKGSCSASFLITM